MVVLGIVIQVFGNNDFTNHRSDRSDYFHQRLASTRIPSRNIHAYLYDDKLYVIMFLIRKIDDTYGASNRLGSRYDMLAAD